LGSAEALIAEINEQYQGASLVLVGHEPDLSELISVLVAGNPSMAVALKKGGLCCLSVVELRFAKCADLAWLLTPAMLVALSDRHSRLEIA
jgi:phosphohistidine phosphatase